MGRSTGAADGTSRTTIDVLSPDEELAAYEGLRHGDIDAFRLVAARAEPLLHRLVGLSTDDRRVRRLAVADTWDTRLRALGMFTWHTGLVTWIAAGVVRRGRSLPQGQPVSHPPATGEHPGTAGRHRPVAGPVDWSDLPFGARWEDAMPVLAAAHAALPLPVREVLHTHHVERWTTQQGCDVLGTTAVAYDQRRRAGHRALHAALADVVGERAGEGPVPPDRQEPIGAALRLLHGPRARPPSSPDPLTTATFRIWAAGLDPRLHRVARRVLSRLPHREHLQ